MSDSSQLDVTRCAATADLTPLPGVRAPSGDSRLLDAWCEWLGALATDAEAALAAAIAYRELDARARNSWLVALEQDAARLSVPKVAVYAPLLAVESDPERRDRITKAMGPADSSVRSRRSQLGLWGVDRNGCRIALIVLPLYLDFVQVLACSYRPNKGFNWVRHDPIVVGERAPRAGDRFEGADLESISWRALIDELAVAVLAHRRSGLELPEALRVFADLFDPGPGVGACSVSP